VGNDAGSADTRSQTDRPTDEEVTITASAHRVPTQDHADTELDTTTADVTDCWPVEAGFFCAFMQTRLEASVCRSAGVGGAAALYAVPVSVNPAMLGSRKARTLSRESHLTGC